MGSEDSFLCCFWACFLKIGDLILERCSAVEMQCGHTSGLKFLVVC